MAENAFEAIRTAMPDSLKYEAGYDNLCQKLLDLDEEVGEMCRCSANNYFIIYHPALTYFARDYGLQQVAIEHEGKEVSAKRLASIIDAASDLSMLSLRVCAGVSGGRRVGSRAGVQRGHYHYVGKQILLVSRGAPQLYQLQ